MSISNNDQRVLFWDDSLSSFTDLTKIVNNFYSGFSSLEFQGGDYLYFGSFLPFNNKYFNIGAPNSTESTIGIQLWDGDTWKDVSDILDYTILNDAALGKSEVIQFTPDYNGNWGQVNRTTTSPYLTEFQNGPDIFWKYWARLSFSVPVSFQLKYVGSLFASESDLFSEYPSLNQSVLLNSWLTNKTTWLDQRVLASEYIISDLKRRGVIVERSQVIELATLTYACVHKAANIIYSGLGARNYQEEIEASGKAYIDAMNQAKFETDVNGDAIKDPFEQNVTTHRATR